MVAALEAGRSSSSSTTTTTTSTNSRVLVAQQAK